MPDSEPVMQECDALYALMDYIVDFISPDWDLFDFAAVLTGDRLEYQLVEATGLGEFVGAVPPPEEIVPLITRLREEEYLEVQGAWFRFRARALRRQNGKVLYYRTDNIEPKWQTGIPPAQEYRADLARFPRPPEEIPAWLSARMEGRPVLSRPVFAIDDPLVPQQNAVENARAYGEIVDYLLEFAPLGWRTLILGICATGTRMELTPIALMANGTAVDWELPAQAYDHIRAFREGNIISPINPWLSFKVIVQDDTKGEGHAEFNAVPGWEVPPTSADYYTDFVRVGFPLDSVEPVVREKYEQALAEAGIPPYALVQTQEAESEAEAVPGADSKSEPESEPEPETTPQQALSQAKLFDSMEDGRPVVNRSNLRGEEPAKVLAYLNAAPAILSARSYGPDAFVPNNPRAVPLSFHTDGTWIWPGAAAYYLEKYGLPPDNDLLAHIRANDYLFPEVTAEARAAALDIVLQRP